MGKISTEDNAINTVNTMKSMIPFVITPAYRCPNPTQMIDRMIPMPVLF
jgi:hypothetical protein